MAAFQRGIGLAESQQHRDIGDCGADHGRTATAYPEPFREEPVPPAAPTAAAIPAARTAGAARQTDAHHAHGTRDDGGPVSRPDHTARPDGSTTAG
jgi:hypothetical protein